jgi:hypothetical protein
MASKSSTGEEEKIKKAGDSTYSQRLSLHIW